MSGETFAEEISRIRPASVLIVLRMRKTWYKKRFKCFIAYMVKNPLLSARLYAITAILEDVIILTNASQMKNPNITCRQFAIDVNTIPSIVKGIWLFNLQRVWSLATLMGSKKGGDTRSVVESVWKQWVQVRLILVDVYNCYLRVPDLPGQKLVQDSSWIGHAMQDELEWNIRIPKGFECF